MLKILSAKDARRMDTFIQFGLAAGIEAFKDSGIVVTEENAERIGVSIGSGIGGIQFIEETNDIYQEVAHVKYHHFLFLAPLST